MSAIAVVYWVCWILWAFFGVGRYWPFREPMITYGGDVLLVIILLIIGLALFPLRL